MVAWVSTYIHVRGQCAMWFLLICILVHLVCIIFGSTWLNNHSYIALSWLRENILFILCVFVIIRKLLPLKRHQYTRNRMHWWFWCLRVHRMAKIWCLPCVCCIGRTNDGIDTDKPIHSLVLCVIQLLCQCQCQFWTSVFTSLVKIVWLIGGSYLY